MCILWLCPFGKMSWGAFIPSFIPHTTKTNSKEKLPSSENTTFPLFTTVRLLRQAIKKFPLDISEFRVVCREKRKESKKIAISPQRIEKLSI